MKTAQVVLFVILPMSLLISAILHISYSGAYVYITPSDRSTYWIGPVSTSIPFVFWAIVTICVALMNQSQPRQMIATIVGYSTGWIAMTAFDLWIVSLPRAPNSSTMGIAIGLTPFVFGLIFPIFFALGYVVTATALQPTPKKPGH